MVTVDKIPFRQATDAAAADEALNAMQDLLDAGVGGQFSMRGGKNGENPGPHAYQYQYSLGVDNYAEYTVVPPYFLPVFKDSFGIVICYRPEVLWWCMGFIHRDENLTCTYLE